MRTLAAGGEARGDRRGRFGIPPRRAVHAAGAVRSGAAASGSVRTEAAARRPAQAADRQLLAQNAAAGGPLESGNARPLQFHQDPPAPEEIRDEGRGERLAQGDRNLSAQRVFKVRALLLPAHLLHRAGTQQFRGCARATDPQPR